MKRQDKKDLTFSVVVGGVALFAGLSFMAIALSYGGLSGYGLALMMAVLLLVFLPGSTMNEWTIYKECRYDKDKEEPNQEK